MIQQIEMTFDVEADSWAEAVELLLRRADPLGAVSKCQVPGPDGPIDVNLVSLANARNNIEMEKLCKSASEQ